MPQNFRKSTIVVNQNRWKSDANLLLQLYYSLLWNKAQKWPCQLTQNANLLLYLELKEVRFSFFSFFFLSFFFRALFHCLKHWVVGRRISWVTMWQKLWTYSAQHKLRIYLEILEQKWCCSVHHTSVDSFFFFVLLLLLLLRLLLLLWWLKKKNFWPEGAIGVCVVSKLLLCQKRVCYWVKNKKAFLWSCLCLHISPLRSSKFNLYLLTYLLTYHFVKMCFFRFNSHVWSRVYALSLSLFFFSSPFWHFQFNNSVLQHKAMNGLFLLSGKV